MGETVTLLEHRVQRAVERLRTLEAGRGRTGRALNDAADALEALAAELREDPDREGA
jgi:hypothetical protein